MTAQFLLARTWTGYGLLRRAAAGLAPLLLTGAVLVSAADRSDPDPCTSDPCGDGCPMEGRSCCELGFDCCDPDPESDCNANGVADAIDIAVWTSFDCNSNGIPDSCDIASGCDVDTNGNGVPDTCQFQWVDLDIDSDNNDGIGMPRRDWWEERREGRESDFGKALWLNDDDDDGDGVADWNDDEVAGENDLVPLVLGFSHDAPFPGETAGYALGYDATKLRIWRSPMRGAWAFAGDALVQANHTYTHSLRVLGDLNANGRLDGDGVEPYEDADREQLESVLLAGAAAFHDWWAGHPVYAGIPEVEARAIVDINGDDQLDAYDLNAFDAMVAAGITRYAPLRFWIEVYDTPGLSGEITVTLDHVDAWSDSVGWSRWVEPDHCAWPDGYCTMHFGEPPGSPCDVPDFESRCWAGYHQGRPCWYAGGSEETGTGMLNWSPGQGFGPADFPPLATAPAASSTPLLSRESAHSGGDIAYPERAMHQGVMDLATGTPLLQEIDFTLPFGGAVFRHVRTYGQNVADEWNSHPDDFVAQVAEYAEYDFPQAGFWDWNGVNWMMGENPLFIIDARWRHLVEEGGKRCYFVPDAHHSIPFNWVPGTTRYEAPPWFDAVLSYSDDGVMDPDTGTWSTMPEYFYVWLHRGAVKYTIKAIYEDLPWYEYDTDDDADGLVVHMHAAPFETGDPPRPVGFGWPYYGITTQIEDRYGNTIRMHYCDFRQTDCDNPDTAACNECCQNCHQKGQLKAVTLHAAGMAADEAVWTLVYVHREFRVPWSNAMARQTAVHSLYVYEGYVDPDTINCLTLAPEDFPSATYVGPLQGEEPPLECEREQPDGVHGIHALNAYDAVEHADLPSGSVFHVRYMYEEMDYLHYYPCYAMPNEYGREWPEDGGQLKKVTVVRPTGEPGRSNEQTTVYWNAPTAPSLTVPLRSGPKSGLNSQLSTLQAVFYDQSVQRIVNALAPSCDEGTASANLLFTHGKSADVPGTGNTLAEMADLLLMDLNSGFDRTEVYRKLAKFAGHQQENTLPAPGVNLRMLVDNRAGVPHAGRYVYYGFRVFPFAVQERRDAYHGAKTDFYPTLFHYPYRVPINAHPTDYRLDAPRCCYGLDEFEPPDLAETRFMVVVDELDPEIEDELLEYRPYLIDSNGFFQASQDCGIRSRRVIELNPTGIVLKDRTWTIEENGDVAYSQEGSGEEYRFDCFGRMIQQRTRSWSVARREERGDQEGLIYVYAYDDPPSVVDTCPWDAEADACNCEEASLGGASASELPRDPVAIGIAQGTDALTAEGVYYLNHIERDPDRPDLVTREVTFDEPVLDHTAAGAETCACYTYVEPGDPTSGVKAKAITRPTVTGTDSEPYHAVEYSIYADDGNLEWFGWGGEKEGEPGTYNQFFANYNRYDEYGRPELQVVDADPDSPEYDFPDGWTRVADEDTSALDLRTGYIYEEPYGLRQVTYPNGREMHIVYKTDPARPRSLEVWHYPDVDPDTGRVLSPVAVTYLLGGQVESKIKLGITTLDSYPPDGESYSAEDVIVETDVAYDGQGRVTGVEQRGGRGEDVPKVSSAILYYPNGEPQRVQEANGTITRYTFTELGQVRKVFRGTQDDHAYWGTSPCDEGSDDPCPDDMVLIERRTYGTDVTDVEQVTEVRHFNRRPANQYYFVNEDGELEPPVDEDEIGWRTEHFYDWRMREVWVRRYGEGGETADLQGNTLTWYDHQDRAIAVADYGPEVPVGVDPTAVPLGDSSSAYVEAVVVPAITSAVATTPFQSLTVYKYNHRGLVEETRQYDWTQDGDEPHILSSSTFTFYDHADRTIEVHSPGGPIQQYVYDAKNRQVETRSLVETDTGRVELARAKTEYDDNDRAITTTRYERRWDASDPALTPSLNEDNSVLTYVYTWYDKAGRIVATVDFGTNADTYTYADSEAPPAYAALASPASFDDAGAITGCRCSEYDGEGGCLEYGDRTRVTCYGYDEAGRQNLVIGPGGIATRTVYDGLGRVVLVIENADWIGGNPDPEQQFTAYRYIDTNGVLTDVAAVERDHNGGNPIAGPEDINWDAADGTLQVTHYEYGAPVAQIDAASGTYTAVSRHNGWMSGVYSPDPDTGQPEAEPSIEFTYRFDGQVASRLDARDVLLEYIYDDRDRLARIVADVPEAMTSNGFPWLADGTAAELAYEYTDDGLLQTASVANSNGALINTTRFTYGAFDTVTTATQQFRPDGEDALAVEYRWDFGGVDGGGRDHPRLAGMTYPFDSGDTITFAYGAAGGVDDALDRLTGIGDAGGWLVGYRYMGTGRRIEQVLGNGIMQAYDGGSSGAVVGLDGHGRVLDIHYAAESGSVLRYRYAYDARGNRTMARVEGQGFGHSWNYGYDDLDRLLFASQGELEPDSDGFVATPVATRWTLDDLGNWSAGPDQVSVRRFADVAADGVYDAAADIPLTAEHHETNESNEIVSRVTGGAGGCVARFVYDPAGNLVFDGERYYVYDAWNRVVSIHGRGDLSVDEDGHLVGDPGPSERQYEYDALGRRVRTIEHPTVPGGAAGAGEPKTTRHVYGTGAAVLAEYDEADDGSLTLGRWFVHGESFPDPLVMVDETDAGDEPAGTPEFLYYLKNVLGSVGALADAAGRVVERYVYSPYGETTILPAVGSPALPAAVPASAYHDADLDGDIDLADMVHLYACRDSTPADPACVFFHDRNGDHMIDVGDVEAFADFEDFDPAGTPPPSDWWRGPTVFFDIDADGDLDERDFFVFQECFGTATGGGSDGPTGGGLPGGPGGDPGGGSFRGAGGALYDGGAGRPAGATAWTAGETCTRFFDIDADGQVDLDDYIVLGRALSGPAAPPPPGGAGSRYGNPFAFTGQRYEPSTNLYHFWARVYAPALGRWLQKDPMGPLAVVRGVPGFCPMHVPPSVEPVEPKPSVEFTDGLNVYQYVESIPTLATDSSGRLLGGLQDTLSTMSLSLYVRGGIFASAHPVAVRIAGGLLAAINLYAMATDPEYLDIVMAQPDAFGLLRADFDAMLETGGTIRALIREPLALGRLIPRNGFRLATDAEAWLAKMYGGENQVTVRTSQGVRKIDNLSLRHAREAKVGYKAWGTAIWEQIRKDGEILRTGIGDINKYTWHFFRSATTGKVGADPRVLQALRENNILFVIHN